MSDQNHLKIYLSLTTLPKLGISAVNIAVNMCI
jgi:hypothetical protein